MAIKDTFNNSDPKDAVQAAVELLRAAKDGDYERANALLEKGVDINAQDGDGWTALHWAAHEDHEAMIALLISQKATIDIEDDDGCTALHRDWCEDVRRQDNMLLTAHASARQTMQSCSAQHVALWHLLAEPCCAAMQITDIALAASRTPEAACLGLFP